MIPEIVLEPGRVVAPTLTYTSPPALLVFSAQQHWRQQVPDAYSTPCCRWCPRLWTGRQLPAELRQQQRTSERSCPETLLERIRQTDYPDFALHSWLLCIARKYEVQGEEQTPHGRNKEAVGVQQQRMLPVRAFNTAVSRCRPTAAACRGSSNGWTCGGRGSAFCFSHPRIPLDDASLRRWGAGCWVWVVECVALTGHRFLVPTVSTSRFYKTLVKGTSLALFSCQLVKIMLWLVAGMRCTHCCLSIDFTPLFFLDRLLCAMIRPPLLSIIAGTLHGRA